MAIRKDANTLSASEREEFVSAVKALKANGIYDQFVLRHANAVMTAIHRCPAFLPWHRRYLWDFERELQRISGNPNLGVPYWNWPRGNENASMWDDDFLGGNGNFVSLNVETGPFRAGEWTVVNSNNQQAGPLQRAFGRESWARSLPTQAEIDSVLAVVPYDVFPWNTGSSPSFRNQLEGFDGPNLHNRGHGWVGGSMLPMTSPNDPVFFMNHCMVDKLWHEWQLRFPNHNYLPTSGGALGQNLTDAMDSTPPGAVGPRPIDVLDSVELGIEYDQLLPGTPDPQGPSPIEPPEEQVLIVNGAVVNASIETPGEVDRYRFEVPAFGHYTVETSGNSDTFLTLYGPDDSTLEVARDDDSGTNFNASISRNLGVGVYFPRLRLYSAAQTGNYAIQVINATGPSIPELVLGDPDISASISVANESDLYRFHINASGVFSVETRGTTDTFMTLYGPNDQTTVIDTDDDSGPSLNAKITANLGAGEYFVRVRHYSASRTGAYEIGLRSGS